jgi:uncharacterized membrane protein YbhN (UPF0104 family)
MNDALIITLIVCAVVITLLLSLLIIRLIRTLGEVERVIKTTNYITSNVSQAVNAVVSFGSVFSPMVGVTRKVFKKRK